MEREEHWVEWTTSKSLNVVLGMVVYSLAAVNAVLLYVLYIGPCLFPEGLQPNGAQGFSVLRLVSITALPVMGTIMCPALYYLGRKDIVKNMAAASTREDRFGYIMVFVMFIILFPIVGSVSTLVVLLCDSPQELLGPLLEGSALGPFAHGLCHGSPR